MYRQLRHRFIRTTGGRRLAQFRLSIVAAAALTAGTEAGAGELLWSLGNGLDLSGQFEYLSSQGQGILQKSVMAHSWLELKSPYRNWSGGVIANYSHALEHAATNSTAIGAFLKFRFDRWRTTLIGGQSGSNLGHAVGVYGSITSFDIDDRQYIGIEAFGALRAPMSPSVMLVYGRDITRSLSVSVGAGGSIVDGTSRRARLEIGWNLW